MKRQRLLTVKLDGLEVVRLSFQDGKVLFEAKDHEPHALLTIGVEDEDGSLPVDMSRVDIDVSSTGGTATKAQIDKTLEDLKTLRRGIIRREQTPGPSPKAKKEIDSLEKMLDEGKRPRKRRH